jgi:hypothetical protein
MGLVRRNASRELLHWSNMAAGVLLTLLPPAVTFASHPCGSGKEPWVAVLFAEGNWSQGIREAILLDLRAGLSNHHIETCGPGSAAGAQPPAATIQLWKAGLDAVHVTVGVRDAVTNKELHRDVDLSHVPSDGHALAIALAADELLWASWAEIALHRPQRKIHASPRIEAEVARNLAPSPAAHRQLPIRLGMQLSVEDYARSLTQVGPDLAFSFSGSERFGSRLVGGYRQGFEVASPHGRIASSAVVAGFDIVATLVQMARLELTWSVGERFAWCHFEGKAGDVGLSGQLNGLALYAQTSLMSALRVGGPLWLQLAAGAGFPLRGVEASDAGQVVTGVAGVQRFALFAVMVDL